MQAPLIEGCTVNAHRRQKEPGDEPGFVLFIRSFLPNLRVPAGMENSGNGHEFFSLVNLVKYHERELFYRGHVQRFITPEHQGSDQTKVLNINLMI